MARAEPVDHSGSASCLKHELLGRSDPQREARSARAIEGFPGGDDSKDCALFERLKATGLPVEVGSGDSPSTIALSEASPRHTGSMPPVWDAPRLGVCRRAGWSPLLIRVEGHGCRRVRNVNGLGFPVQGPRGPKRCDASGRETSAEIRAVSDLNEVAKIPPEKNILGGAYQRTTTRPSARPPFLWHAPARGRRMHRRCAQMGKYGQSLPQVSADR
ncbi:hypothetical protein Krac_0405 [Ktedonobacter racemifer DSM 44963]|uniref:Uncharacterized protein n=1 Tax=Ktedonobacter racemifer DSM 44963 TaxID=485913 RepID=D6U7M2_KTERA|nr:hypothetical protein Krac_0405 [Ktedonobacter racemifer DSM 44963]